jgi:hydrogenase expression/formation protein HypE
VAVLSQRQSPRFDATIEPASTALHTRAAAMFAAVPEGAVHALRDPPRAAASPRR